MIKKVFILINCIFITLFSTLFISCSQEQSPIIKETKNFYDNDFSIDNIIFVFIKDKFEKRILENTVIVKTIRSVPNSCFVDIDIIESTNNKINYIICIKKYDDGQNIFNIGDGIEINKDTSHSEFEKKFKSCWIDEISTLIKNGNKLEYLSVYNINLKLAN